MKQRLVVGFIKVVEQRLKTRLQSSVCVTLTLTQTLDQVGVERTPCSCWTREPGGDAKESFDLLDLPGWMRHKVFAIHDMDLMDECLYVGQTTRMVGQM